MKQYVALLLTLAFSLPVFAAKSPHYQYYRIGLEDVSTQTVRGTVLMGGAAYVDDAFKWMCLLSGKGDFLVLRARGKDEDNAYIKNLCSDQNSVATLIIPSVEAANDDDVAAIINNAEAIFIEGGDQSDYIKYWAGTKAQVALQQRASQGIPIGGISAGLDVLTQFVYSALLSKGATSSEALADPFNKYITLDNKFDLKLPFLEGIIGDAHVVARDRMGRDIAFLCRVYDSGWSNHPRGISVDEKTALLIDENGEAVAIGNSNVYFLQAPGAPEVCQSGSPLTYRNVSVYRINALAGSFNLWSWSGFHGSEYDVSAVEGMLISDQANGSPY
ncbi:MAG: cyanophycinase [Nitrosomonadaceae bacterium]|nr:cyanophycinase [Nitrosomonadaceae bacterium]